MSLLDTLGHWLARLSRRLGLETIDSFPPGHAYARTRWDPAYFDIPSDMPVDAIERTLCEAIANTPLVFGHIASPTPAMQRALLAVIEARLRRQPSTAVELLALLIAAYDSPHTVEAIPGLRAVIADTADLDVTRRAHAVVRHLGTIPAGFDIIDGAIR